MADLQGRALDAAVAERVMWWSVYWFDSEMVVKFGTDDVVPHYSSNANAVALVRAEIERRGLVDAFIRELRRALYAKYGDDDTMPQLWRFANADPETNCRAALKAVEGANA